MDASEERIFSRGKVAASIRSTNWSNTPLGPIETWPNHLVDCLNMMLSSAFPVFIFWGPKLYQFYNDACLPLLAGKHPRSLGQPASECWVEAWSIVGSQLKTVWERGETVTHEKARVPVEHNGVLEDVYWNYSYSPIYDHSHAVAGILVLCQDVTEQLLGARRADDGEERFTCVLRMIEEAVIVTDALGRVEQMSRGAEALTGWMASEAAGQPLEQVLQISRQQNGAAVGSLLRELGERATMERRPQTVYNCRGKAPQAVELSGCGLDDSEGNRAGAVVVLRRLRYPTAMHPAGPA